jgi:hypothetical protein
MQWSWLMTWQETVTDIMPAVMRCRIGHRENSELRDC